MELSGLGELSKESFEIVAELGAGSCGTVYKARQVGLDRLVALKVLKQTDAVALARFHREAQILAQLKHRNICQCFHFGVEKGVPFMALELIEAPTLRSIMAGKQLDWRQSAQIGIQICAGLRAAHDMGVIHRDLKPENIMLMADGVVKILDFGLSGFDSESSQKLTQANVTLGTPPYMSPEQCTAGRLDARSDIYALGCLLFECVAGTPPFLGETISAVMFKHESMEPPPLADYVSVPQGYEAIVRKALRKDPNRRYQSAEDFGLALSELLENPGASGPRFNLGQGADPRKVLRYLVPAVGAVLLIGGLAWVFRPAVTLSESAGAEGIPVEGSRQGLAQVSRLAFAKTDAGKQQAQKLLSKIILVEEARIPPDREVLFDAYMLSAGVFDPPAVEQCLQKTVALCRTPPEESERLLEALWALARIQQMQGKNAEASLLELSSSSAAKDYLLWFNLASAGLCREYAIQGRTEEAARHGINACVYLSELHGGDYGYAYPQTIASLLTLNSKVAIEKSDEYLASCTEAQKKWIWQDVVEQSLRTKQPDAFLRSVNAIDRLKQEAGASLGGSHRAELTKLGWNLGLENPAMQEKISLALETVLPAADWMPFEMERAWYLVSHQDVAAGEQIVKKCQRRFHQEKDWPLCYQTYLDKMLRDSPDKRSRLLPLYDANLVDLGRTCGVQSPDYARALWQRAQLNRALHNADDAWRDINACEAIVVKESLQGPDVGLVREWKAGLDAERH